MLLEIDLATIVRDDRALTRRTISALVDASIAVWRTTERRGVVPFSFDGREYAGEGGPVHDSCTDAYWVESVLRAIVLRRQDAVEQALAFPPELLNRASNLESDAYREALFRSLRAVLADEPEVAGHQIARAKELTDPAIATIGGPRHARRALGELEVMDAIVSRDESALTRAMVVALEAHRALFGRGRERSYLDCFYAHRLMGLAALATTRGLAFEIECAYAPRWLVEGTA
jgi:hypothetical protein